jgi:hypothetical protein
MVLSKDGYIRLPLKQLLRLKFAPIISAPDKNILAELAADGQAAAEAGYTEWITQTDPCISVGWDWYRDKSTQRVLFAGNDVRSNVMLVDTRGRDLGMHLTAVLMSAWLTTFNWQETIEPSLYTS